MQTQFNFGVEPFPTGLRPDPDRPREAEEAEEEFGRGRGFRPWSGRAALRPTALRSSGPGWPIRRKRPLIRPVPPYVRLPWLPGPAFAEPYPVSGPEPLPGEPEPPGPEKVRRLQDCLTRILRLRLPVTGSMDAGTRSALRSFQRQQGLPGSALLDPATREALGSACELPPAGPAADDNAPEPDLARGYGEILTGESADFSNEELRISKQYQVRLTRGGPENITDPASLDKLPTEHGVYFIFIDVTGRLQYVGKASSIRSRFQDRFKTFSDFNISPPVYSPWLAANRVQGGWYLLSVIGDPPVGGIQARDEKRKPPWASVPMVRKERIRLALLRAVEQYFIHKLRPPGNVSKECVYFTPSGAIEIAYATGGSPARMKTVFCATAP